MDSSEMNPCDAEHLRISPNAGNLVKQNTGDTQRVTVYSSYGESNGAKAWSELDWNMPSKSGCINSEMKTT